MHETTPMRCRDFGRVPGVLPSGAWNAITDVEGVRVGHDTVMSGESTRTGVTAILPHSGNLYLERVPAGVDVANGYGKAAGFAQVDELGELETPIVLVNTLSVGRAVEALVDWTLSRPGCERVTSVNAVVAETNDSPLNDIRARGIAAANILTAVRDAASGPIAMGAVGAGTGTRAFGYKGGIGSSSRVLPSVFGSYTIGALVQSNFDGVLTLDGVQIGKHSGQHVMSRSSVALAGGGSIVMVVATDAPLSDRNLRRLARRASAGLARTGASFANGSGDFAVAFSTHEGVRRVAGTQSVRVVADLPNDAMSPLFLAAIEATEEAIYDSLLTATSSESLDSFSGQRTRAEAIHKDVLEYMISTRLGPRFP